MGKNKNNTNNGTNKTNDMKGGNTMKKATILYKHNGDTMQFASDMVKTNPKNKNLDVSALNEITRHNMIAFIDASNALGKLAIEIEEKNAKLKEEYATTLKAHKDNAVNMSDEEKQAYSEYLVKVDAIKTEYAEPKKEATDKKKKALKSLVGENTKVRTTDKKGNAYTMYQAYCHYISSDKTKSGIFKDAVKSFLIGTGIVSEYSSYATGTYKKFMDNFIASFGLKSASDKDKYNGEQRCKVMSQTAFVELFADRFIDMVSAIELAENEDK